jgi:hypothetical protein
LGAVIDIVRAQNLGAVIDSKRVQNLGAVIDIVRGSKIWALLLRKTLHSIHVGDPGEDAQIALSQLGLTTSLHTLRVRGAAGTRFSSHGFLWSGCS